MKPELSLIIPMYNEEFSAGDTIKDLIKEFEKQEINYEIIAVNHGSTDKTNVVLEKISKKNKRLKVINFKKNLGYGGGVMYGFKYCEGKYIGFSCADGEISAEDTYKVYYALKKGDYDVSKSKRLKRKDGLIRITISRVFNFLVSVRFCLHIKDMNGYPVFTKREIFKDAKVKEKAYLFSLDFLRKMKKKRYSIVEIPVVHQKRKGGKSFMSPLRIIEMVVQLLRYSIK